MSENWISKKIEDIAISKNGIVRGPFGGSLKKSVFVDRGYKVYEQKNAIYSSYSIGDYYINESLFTKMERFKVQADDFIVSCSGTIGSLYRIPNDAPPGIINQALLKLRINTKKVDLGYFEHYFKWDKFQNKIIDNSQGGAIKNLVGMNIFRRIEMSCPPLPEQKKIAEILSTWDEAIEFNEKLLDTEKQQKRVYVSYIYTKRHVTDIENMKKFEKLGKHLVEKTERNKDELINDVLSVSNTRGFVLQSAQFEREIASKDKKNYKVVRKDQFAYNPSRVNVGSIDQLSERDSGIISPMYVVFQCKDSIKGRYLYHFLKSDYFLRLIPRFTQGSVRDSLSFDGLCEMKIHIPSIDKQTKYSQLLDSLDIKIKLIERNIEYLKTQKQGLMQRLLTGKVRVKLD